MHDPIDQMSNQEKACADRLRGLPTEVLPPYNWQEFQRRSGRRLGSARPVAGLRAGPSAGRSAGLNAGRSTGSNAGPNPAPKPALNPGPSAAHRLDGRHMAAAAVLLLIVCGTAVWGRWGRDAHDRMLEDASSQAVVNQTGRQNGRLYDGLPSSNAASVAVLRSKAIENWLATLPREPVVVHVGTRAAVAQLEDRIAQVDDLLTSVRLEGMRPDGLAALQQERVRLVGSLAQVRYAEVVAAESP